MRKTPGGREGFAEEETLPLSPLSSQGMSKPSASGKPEGKPTSATSHVALGLPPRCPWSRGDKGQAGRGGLYAGNCWARGVQRVGGGEPGGSPPSRKSKEPADLRPRVGAHLDPPSSLSQDLPSNLGSITVCASRVIDCVLTGSSNSLVEETL